MNKNIHVTYCTNIHTSNNWEECCKNIKHYSVEIAKKIKQNFKYSLNENYFPLGLRFSGKEVEEIQNSPFKFEFLKNLLESHNLFPSVLNAFPYGDFHRAPVKENVHQPDWFNYERVKYTINMANLLVNFVKDKNYQDNYGISTNPIGYKYTYDRIREYKNFHFWHQLVQKSVYHFIEVVKYFIEIEKKTNVNLHLDIEPEPDGIIETSEEMILFFNEYLLLTGVNLLSYSLGISTQKAEMYIRRHINICYDICHCAVLFENSFHNLQKYGREGIKIGRIQVSSALSVLFDQNRNQNLEKLKLLKEFSKSIYLHQISENNNTSSFIKQHRDLEGTLETILPYKIAELSNSEWRIHFHVPIFLSHYGLLNSTQNEILNTLKYLKKNPDITSVLEIETYTWRVLPVALKIDLTASIIREYQWLIENLRL